MTSVKWKALISHFDYGLMLWERDEIIIVLLK